MGIPGTENLNLPSIDFGAIFTGIGLILAMIVMFVVIAGSIYFYFDYKNKHKNKKKIDWFEEVNGQMVPVDFDEAVELTIPRTNIKVFYIKRKDMYMPRPVKRMGNNRYWMCIKNNREIVNFTMKNMNEEMTEANLDYDHTDMRYALSNLQALIQRNYRDNSLPWWKEYKDVIAIVVLVFVLSLSAFFILMRLETLIDKIGTLVDHADQLIQAAKTLQGSGVVAA